MKKYCGPRTSTSDGIFRRRLKLICCWSGACVVHEEFKSKALDDLRKVYPEAGILVHPESPGSVIASADVVGSTKAIVDAAAQMPNEVFIVATDRGIFTKLRQQNPGKTFIEAPTAVMGQHAGPVPIAHGWQ